MLSLLRDRQKSVLVLLAVTLVTFGSALTFDFVNFDDNSLIYQNPNVTEFNARTVTNVFTSYDPELYIPLPLLTYQIEYAVFGNEPFIFHLTNLLLHLGCVWLVYNVVFRLAEAKRQSSTAHMIALMTALIFAVHPLQTEAVVWASSRKDLLSTLFMLISLLQYLRYLSDEKRSYRSSVVFFALALASKATVVVYPVALILIDLYLSVPVDRRSLTQKIPYAVLSVVFGVIAIFGKSTQLGGLSLIEKILVGSKGTLWYLYKTVLPTGIGLFYPQDYPVSVSAHLVISVLIVTVLGIVALLSWKRWKIFAFGTLWYLLFVAPTFATFWKNGFVYFASDRYAYVPLIGVAFVVSFLLVDHLRERAVNTVLIILTLVLVPLSVAQAQIWHDSMTLLEHTATLHPDSPHALNNYATTIYEEEGDLDRAIELYDRAIAINPYIPEIYTNKGFVLLLKGEREQAEAAFRAGMKAVPDYRPMLEADLKPYFGLVSMYEEEGRSIEVRELLEEAYRIGPDFFFPNYYLGIKLHEAGQLEEAYERFRKANEVYAHLADSQYRFAAVAAALGRLDEAETALKKVLSLEPNHIKARDHLENIRSMK